MKNTRKNYGTSLMNYDSKIERKNTHNGLAMLLLALPLLPIVAVIVTHLPK